MSDAFRFLMAANRIAARGTMTTAKTAARVAGNAQYNGSVARGHRQTSIRVLGPGGSPPPLGIGDFYDYRGVATAKEVRGLDERRLGRVGFRLGRLIDVSRGPGAPLAVPAEVFNRHAAVVGPNGSGKTAGVLIPWIDAALRSGNSVVAIDVKGDLKEDILAYIAASPYGPAGVMAAKWDFTDPARSMTWDWIGETRTDAEIDAAVTAILGRAERSTADPFFYRRDFTVLRGLFRLLPTIAPPGSAITPAMIIRLLADQTRLEQYLGGFPNAPGVTDLTSSLSGLSRTDYPRAISGVTTALAKLDLPGLNTVSAPSSFTLADLFARPALLVVVAPRKAGEAGRMVASLFLNLFAQRLYNRFGNRGQQVFLVVDEAPRVADRFDFEEVLSISRSAGVSVCIAAQDVAQFSDEAERTAIFGNCMTYVSLAGVSDVSATLLAKRLGERRVPKVTRSKDHSRYGVNTSHNIETEPVLGEREIMSPPFGARCGIVHFKLPELGLTSKPILLDLQL